MSRAPLGGARVRFGPEIFRLQGRGGVSRYVVELHRGLLERSIDSEIVAGLHVSSMLERVPRVRGRSVAGLRPGRARQALTRGVDAVVADRAARRLGPGDVWHPSYFPRRIPRGVPAGPTMAVTVYDMIHERYPREVQPSDPTVVLKAAACRAADVVLAISQDTAADLIERLHVDPARVVVTPLGVRAVDPVPREHPFDGRRYLAYVGERRAPHKNWLTLLDALREVHPELGVVCIGAPPGPEDQAAVAARGLVGRVRFEGGSDAEVAGRLAGAAGLVYPSRYEGFGLPPLEALAQGCPVVASRVGAIPEVVGSIAIMVEPTVEGLGAGIETLLADGDDVARQRRDGPAHAAQFPWSATVDATIGAYQRALET
jgi:glycosyltransferase involved in cell wall biosynthesis